MKETKLIISFIMILFIISIYKFSYATDSDRLVDIPVPDNSTGFADSTLEEKNRQIREYEEKQEKQEQKEVKERKMKKYGCIIITVIALIVVVATINFTIKHKNKNDENISNFVTNDGMSEEEKIIEEEVKNTNQEEVEKIKEEISATANSDIYYVTEEPDGRKILQIKPNVQFEVDLAGIIKKSIPEEKEIEDLNKKAPNKTGVWISENSREAFLELLQENNVGGLSIQKDGYLKVDSSSEDELSKRLEDMIKSNKLYIINMTGIAYEKDYLSGEIVEYPFEDMDPEQIIEPYKNGNRIILEVTTNKLKKITNNEILTEITLY